MAHASVSKESAVRKPLSPHVAMYMRVSSEDQAERGTIGAQQDFLRQFTQLYQLHVADEYADDGVTGTLPLGQRPAGRRLLEDARIGRFGCVLVYRVDRLGRSLHALLDAHTVLTQSEVTIRSATEPFDTSTSIGTFMFQLLGSLAELEKSTILERMTLGRDRVAKQGRWTGGTIPLGYDLDAEGFLIPSTRLVEGLGMTEAELVQDLFQRISQGSTGIAECHRLNGLGIVSARRYANGKVVNVGALWRPSRLNKVLKNTGYIGMHVLKSRQGLIERAIPPLVEQATWDAVQVQLRRNQCLPKNTVHRLYLLRSLITCGLCGCRYIGTPVSRGGQRMDYYYRCSAQNVSHRPEKQGRCPAKMLDAEWLEELVWQDCREYSQHPDEALAEAGRQLQARLVQSERVVEEQQRLQQALAEKVLEKERIMTLFRRGRASLQDTETQLDAIEQEAAALRSTLGAIQAQRDLAEAFEVHYTETRMVLSTLQKEVEDVEQTNDVESKRKVIAYLVSDIRVDTEVAGPKKSAKVTIRYGFDERAVYSTMP